MKHKLLTLDRVAQILGVSRRTLYRLTATGQLPTVMIRTKRLIPFFRCYGHLKPTPVYHQTQHVLQTDLDRVMFEGIPVKCKDRRVMRYPNGHYAPKVSWPEIARKKQLTAIECLDELDLSKLS